MTEDEKLVDRILDDNSGANMTYKDFVKKWAKAVAQSRYQARKEAIKEMNKEVVDKIKKVHLMIREHAQGRISNVLIMKYLEDWRDNIKKEN